MIKDIKGSKPKQVSEVETEDTRESIEELSMILSTANFACNAENSNSIAIEADENDLDIGMYVLYVYHMQIYFPMDFIVI